MPYPDHTPVPQAYHGRVISENLTQFTAMINASAVAVDQGNRLRFEPIQPDAETLTAPFCTVLDQAVQCDAASGAEDQGSRHVV